MIPYGPSGLLRSYLPAVGPGPYDGPVTEEEHGPTPEGEEGPIGDDERELLNQDLTDVEALKNLLGEKGLRGVVFYCPDCDEDHFLGWDLLRSNLKELLDQGESPVHEPAFNPNPDEYVSWDYARGYLDGYESFEEEALGDILGRVVDQLRDKGLAEDQIKGLLAAANLELPDPNRAKG